MRALPIALLLLVAPLAAAQDSGAAPPPNDAIPDPKGAPGSPESAAQPPLAAADIFGDKCQGCHGPDGKGHTKYGKKHKIPDFTGSKWQKGTTDGEILKAVTFGIYDDKGKKLMPGFKDKLSSDQAMSLIPYLRAFAGK